jgi:phi13 family phage major tail protein
MIKTIDVRDFYVAPLTSDTSGGAVYGAMTKLAGLIKIKLTPKSDRLDQYSDSVLADSVDFISSYELEVNLSDLDIPSQALILGHTVTGGVLEVAATDQAPWVGIAFRAQKSNKKWRYVKLLKAKFAIPDDESQTREAKLTGGTATIKAICVCRIYDDKLKQTTDEDQADYNAATGAAWFSAFGAADSTPPTLASVTPASNATGISTGSTVAWVFSEAIQPGCVTKDNFMLVKDSDGSIVAGTLVQSNAGKTVTFTPTSALTGAAVYRPVYTTGVKDLAGNPIAAGAVSKFTCA